MAGFEIEDRLIVRAAREAGRIGLSYFGDAGTDVWYKNGNSPVSQADKEIDEFLRTELLDAEPDYGWLSEETDDNTDRLNRKHVFIVDPIDGTRGFIAGKPEWCISAAVVEDGRPIEGVLFCPALEQMIYASLGNGSFLNGKRIKHRSNRTAPLVTGSKKLIEYLKSLTDFNADVTEFIPSLAYRLSLVALGELDGAFARPGSSEWDVAAADIILSEAGCLLTDKNGNRLTYNKKSSSSPALIAASLKRQDEIFALANSSGILH